MVDANAVLTAQPETPFAELELAQQEEPESIGLLPWTESVTPFAEGGMAGLELEDSEAELFLEAFEELRDEAFDESLAELVAETAEAAGAGTAGEASGAWAGQRAQLAEAHLAPIAAEAERCLQRFIDHVGQVQPSSLSETQVDELLSSFDAGPASVTPAGEEFLGGLLKKAGSIVKKVASTAVSLAGKLVPIGPILNKLKGLIRPLLKRVLGMAIGKLPAPLQQPARDLAKKLGIGEAEAESFDELEDEAEEESLGESFAGSPVRVLDPESLGESFDAAVAGSLVSPEALEEGESFGHDEAFEPEAGTQLEQLAQARSAFMGRVQAAGDGADLTPEMEQFIPAILPALRLGVRLIGRTKVVNFLAGFLAKLIGRWVGPSLSEPLSRAVVDVGLRVIGLERADGSGLEAEAVPAMLAATVEDTVRRMAEQPDHVLEDEGLLQVAVSEAFEQAVAANFPATLVRRDLRLAPSLGGAFVTRHARSPHAYRKFTRTPEVELTAAQAAAVTTFGGATLDASLRAHGLSLPGRFQVHVFEAAAGTTLPMLARFEGILGPSGVRGAYGSLHPLTRANATALLREPGLGVDVPSRFLQSRHRISVGQRFFYLQPIGQQPTAAPTPTRQTAASSCEATRPSDRRMRIDLARGEARVALFFSEADAQKVAAAVTANPTGTALLQALVQALRAANRSLGASDGAVQIPGGATATAVAGPAASAVTAASLPPAPPGTPQSEWEAGWEAEWEAEWERRAWRRTRRRRHHHRISPAHRARLRRRIRAAAATALSAWARSHAQEFVRAAQDARCGVTVLIRVTGLRGGSASAPAATAVRAVPGRRRP